MTITIAQFVADFPEFADASPAVFGFYLDLATMLLNPRRWPTTPSPTTGLSVLDRGTELFVAHNIALEQRTIKEAAFGAPVGVTQGPVSSKGVGPTSVGYDTASGVEADGGHWNTTIYGIRFLRLLRTVAAGPIQVGIGINPNPGTDGPAWPGPWPYPDPTGFSS